MIVDTPDSPEVLARFIIVAHVLLGDASFGLVLGGVLGAVLRVVGTPIRGDWVVGFFPGNLLVRVLEVGTVLVCFKINRIAKGTRSVKVAGASGTRGTVM